jgi:hypothetical protein
LISHAGLFTPSHCARAAEANPLRTAITFNMVLVLLESVNTKVRVVD